MARSDGSYEKMVDGFRAVVVGALFFLAPGLIMAAMIVALSLAVS